jgi:hypothetical protein
LPQFPSATARSGRPPSTPAYAAVGTDLKHAKNELCFGRVGRGECVVAEFAQDVVGASAEFARDREAGAVVVDPLGDVQVVGVVG